MNTPDTKYAAPRTASARGIVALENSEATCFPITDLERWLRVNADAFKNEKVDLLTVQPNPDRLRPLIAEAKRLGMAVSLRTNAATPPAGLLNACAADLLDLFLTPASLDAPHLEAWAVEATRQGLPLRLQWTAPFNDANPDTLAERTRALKPAMVNLALYDPLAPNQPPHANGLETVRFLNDLAQRLADAPFPINILALPFCLADEHLRPYVVNAPQAARTHEHYDPRAFQFATAAVQCRPNEAGKAIIALLGRNTAMTSFVDDKLMPWFLEGTRRHILLLIWRKLTRRLRAVQGYPKPLEPTENAYAEALAQSEQARARALGPQCARCRLRIICDHDSEQFRRAAPGLTLQSIPGEPVPDPFHYASEQHPYTDALDAARIEAAAPPEKLVETALDTVTNRPPTREIDSKEYAVEGSGMLYMPGGNRWYSFSDTEKTSTPLARLTPPFTIAATFGGGIAEYIGFSFGRYAKVLCPMIAYTHQLVLHADATGAYVLLRDGIPVQPAAFEEIRYAPRRLAGVVEPRICICNIDNAIVTQTVLLWDADSQAALHSDHVTYSALIVSTKYSRRLQMVLLCLAHQRHFDLDRLEVVVSYVPGIDATDDIIESMRLAYPRLRIVRVPFPEAKARAKGFMINESAHACSGEWIVLLDSDILVGPDTFAQMDNARHATAFIAADGRKMLTPEVTAQILLGDIQPWRDWEALLQGPGEFRLREAVGVPIGFFQAFKKSCLDRVPYEELNHFEGSDWRFGDRMVAEFGKETRLSGVPVLHLDHGGSQWYGTSKQR